jgi:transposase
MTSTLDRQSAVALINEAVVAGARHYKACCTLKISERTIRRWTKEGVVQSDKRPLVQRAEPPNKLSETEHKAVLDACNSKDFSDLPPSQIVPKLADAGRYLASLTQRGIKLLPHLARRGAAASSGPRQTAHRTQTTHQLPVTRQMRPARSGLGTSPGCLGQSRVCSFIST